MTKFLKPIVIIISLLYGITNNTESQNLIKRLKQLTFEKTVDYSPAWSPDGKHITYAGRGKISSIYKISAENGAPTRLTTVPSGHPQWSPDGRYISFDNYDTKNIQITSANGGVPIQVISNETSGKRRRKPCWSPDGKQIAFYADGNIYSVDLYSGKTQEIHHHLKDESWPSYWSADSLGLLFVKKDIKSSNVNIWSLSKNGKTSQITDFHCIETHPALSPDGSMIAFSSDLNGNMDIWLMCVKTRNKLQLTYDLNKDMTPSWSPDGTKIVFASERNRNRDIWVMELDIKTIKSKLEKSN